MSLKQQLTEDMKTAMKAREAEKLGTIRFLLSAIKNAEIDAGELDDAGIQKVIATQVKQIKESIEEYKKGGREDLVTAEQGKLKVLSAYLPEQMSDEELKQIIQSVIDQSSDKNMGPIIGQVMKQVAGKADGQRVSQLVRELLN